MSAPDPTHESRRTPGAPTRRLLPVALAALLLGVAVGYGLAGEAPPAPREAGARVQELLSESDPLVRVGELARLLSRARPESLVAIRSSYESSALEGGDTELVLFGEWWAEFDPAAALDWALAEPRQRFLELGPSVLRVWARSEPETALARARELRDEVQRALAIEAALIGYDAAPVLPRLADLVYGMTDPSEQQIGARVLARRRVARLGAERTLAWVDTLPDENPSFRRSVRAEVVNTAARSEPRVVARWAEGHIDGETRTGLPRRIGVRWVWLDPEAALAWLEGLPAGRDRDDGLEETYRDWATLDPEAAQRWMEPRVREPWLEPAAVLYIRGIAAERPQQAVGMAQELSDDARRTTTLTQVLRIWLMTDRDAATAWIEASELPPDVRRRAYMTRRRSGPQRQEEPARPR